MKMETQKILNLLNSSGNESLKFATRKWCDIGSKSRVVIHMRIQKIFFKSQYNQAFVIILIHIFQVQET